MRRRAPFQVLIMPFRRCGDGTTEYGALRRTDLACWQGFAGGGEIGETPAEAARRETDEEGGLPGEVVLYNLDAHASVPRCCFSAASEWGPDVFVVVEHAFAVDCTDTPIRLSTEHDKVLWGDYDTVHGALRWDSNRTALWELAERLRTGRMAERRVREP